MQATLPSIAVDHLNVPDMSRLQNTPSIHPPRILLLYGSLRERTCSKLLTLEAERLLQAMGAQTCVFDSAGLPLPDGATADHPRVRVLGRWMRMLTEPQWRQ